ncbi:AAA family ATPase [Shewanella sp. Choline-02u-19]|uniref:AAA family ATPase n=1 Tax=unclassified Shewanella TaxID=196818 RepID=UPI000C3294A9|nr:MULTISPECIES: AAA family ATPase [unclassified Shewanella]PKH62855.1 AAA family ATPase [Shewanella sp. Bg11-22]PKI27022.1 AAA family ATPase [Shewanella sp. Choline-02u-19]
MNITIENCNNLDKANLEIVDKKLNIKFAPNGTGKSTIAKAITLHAEGKDLVDLMPFKLRKDNPESKAPSITIAQDIGKVMCFNEDYVRQFTFQSDELVSNSFNIFIRTDSYIAVGLEIQAIVKDINNLFEGNEELETFTANLNELSSAFKLTKTGLSQSSLGMKGLSQGNKLKHIPEGLEAYEPFINSSDSVNWIDWQTKGSDQFSAISACCPFCSADTVEKKEQIEKVGQEYDKNVIKNLLKIIEVFDKLEDYFTVEAKEKLNTITSLADGLEAEHVAYLKTVKTQIDLLVGRLEQLKALKGFDFKDDEQVKDKLENYKIDLAFLSELNSETTNFEVESINASIDEVVAKERFLQGKIKQQRSGMQNIIEKHQSDINNFLSYAGYKYEVKITGEDDNSQLKLRHVDHDEFVVGGGQHLSFGERNAFAIVLFMYECLAKKPDLIVLDDPISSFDKNKKYAILEMLFRRKPMNCLKSKTVLMLTHDVEPIIDTVKAVAKQFDNQVSASYLRFSNGEIEEQNIRKDDIKTFSQICGDFLTTGADSVLKLIYLRRLYEIIDDRGDAYQMLSNLLHLREQVDAIDTREDGSPIMDSGKLDKGISEIAGKIPELNYDEILARLKDTSALKELYYSCSNGYEKLQVFRLFEIKIDNSVLQKFINETYHIENEYICQLDPSQFDLIPEYVTLACDKCLEAA